MIMLFLKGKWNRAMENVGKMGITIQNDTEYRGINKFITIVFDTITFAGNSPVIDS